MDRMPLLALFLQSMPEEFIVIALGLLLVGYRPPLARLVPVAVLSATASYFIRALPFPFGVHTLIFVAVTVVLVWLILRITWRRAVLAVLLGVTLLALVEGIAIPVITGLTGLSMAQVMSSTWLRILVPWPHMASLGILAWCCWRYRWSLVQAGREEDEGLPF
ncbi:MAG: hypothetical protein H5U00_10165 [Clostridia bacterium]|nr:hypothetical protein [Clostridia bacterium]